MSESPGANLRRRFNDPRILVILSPFILLSPVWLMGKVLYWGTPATQFVPWWSQAWEILRAGQIPLWSPDLGMGAPLLANYQSALLYPPTWIYFLLAALGGIPWLAWGQALLVAAHLAWAGWGMLQLARRLELSILGQGLAGLSFGLSGYLVARAHFLSINAAVAWLPWILLAAYNLVHQPTRRAWLKLAFFLALQWLAGHAQIAWYSLLLLLAWSAFWAWRLDRWSGLRRAGLALLLTGAFAFTLSAAQLLPTFEYLLNSSRLTQVDSQLAFTYSFWPWRFLTLMAPNFFGNPASGDYWGYGNFWEDAVYIGLLPLLLALGTLASLWRKDASRRALRRFLWGLAALAFLLGLGANTPIFPWIYRNLPGFDMFQAPTRITLWALFAFSLLAAQAIENWRQPTGRALYWSRLGVAAAGAVILAAAIVNFLRAAGFQPFTALEPSMIKATFSVGLLALGLAVLNLRAPQPGRRPSPGWTWAILLFLGADLLWAGWGLNPGVDLDFYGSQNFGFADLRAELGEGRLYLPSVDESQLKFERFLRFDTFATREAPQVLRAVHLPNTTLLAGIPSANNFDPLLPRRYQQWIDALESAEAERQQQMLAGAAVSVVERVDEGQPLGVRFDSLEALPRLRWVPCARVVSTSQEAMHLLSSGKLEPGRQIAVELPAAERPEICAPAPQSAAQLSWLEQTPNHLRIAVDAPGGGWLFLADTFYPSWQARADGNKVPIFPADGLFRAIQLPPGQYELEFNYRPLSFWVGAVLSVLAWLSFPLLWKSSRYEAN